MKFTKVEGSKKEPIKLTCQLQKISTTKDGGARIVLDTGLESLDQIQQLMGYSGNMEINFAVVIVPYQEP